MSHLDFDDLKKKHGAEKAAILFEQFKHTPPAYEISPAFAEQIIRELPEGFATFDHAEHGLESPESDYLQWCEHFYLNIPSINAKAFIEVGDSHYYVSLDEETDEYYGGETFKHWKDVVHYIYEATASVLASPVAK